jgi:hypothetical protein
MDNTMNTKPYILAFNNTWSAIAADILEISPNNEIDQEDLIEVVMDYIDAYGGLTKEQYAIWENIPYPKKVEIGKAAFPGGTYGM